jgi:hypothetical protein
MKRWDVWKKIEHWLVIVIIVMTCGGWFIVQWVQIGEPPHGTGGESPECTDAYGRC